MRLSSSCRCSLRNLVGIPCSQDSTRILGRLSASQGVDRRPMRCLRTLVVATSWRWPDWPGSHLWTPPLCWRLLDAPLHWNLPYQRHSCDFWRWFRASHGSLQTVDWSIHLLVYFHRELCTIDSLGENVKIWNFSIFNLMYSQGRKAAPEFRWYSRSWWCGSCSCCALLWSSDGFWRPEGSGYSLRHNHSTKTTAQRRLETMSH